MATQNEVILATRKITISIPAGRFVGTEEELGAWMDMADDVLQEISFGELVAGRFADEAETATPGEAVPFATLVQNMKITVSD